MKPSRRALFLAASFVLACGSSAVTSSSSSVEPADAGAPCCAQDAPSAPPESGDSGAEPREEREEEAQDAGPPRVAFVGRFDTSDANGPWCAWPGCRIVARFDGTEVSVRLQERVEAWMQGGPSEWDVTIDGVLQPKLVLTPGAIVTYPLARGLSSCCTHQVELYKRSETQNGYTQFLGFDFGAGTLRPPPLPATRRIEIIGDSQPAAFGVEDMGLGPNCPEPQWAARYQNFHVSFGARLGEMFGADVTGTVYSGKGLTQNIWRGDPDTMPILYARANPVLKSSTFDLSTLVPDAIVIMLGGNDFAIGQDFDEGPASLAAFTDAFRSFVATLRADYPQAYIWLALSPSLSDEMPAGRATRTNVEAAMLTVTSERQAAGDARVFEIAPAVARPDELTACNAHGTRAYHQRVAQELASAMRPKLGW